MKVKGDSDLLLSKKRTKRGQRPFIKRKPNNMKKFFKVAGIILGVLIGIHIILNITFSIQLRNKTNELKREGRPTTIAEIIPPPVPDEDNAAILYNKAFELMKYEEGSNVKKLSTVEKYLKSLYDISQWTNEQKQEIPKLIYSAELQNIYELLEEGSKKPKYRFEHNYEEGYASLVLPELNLMRKSTRLLCLKALLEAEAGKNAQAFDTLIVGLKISNQMKDETVLMSQLVRIACDGIIIKSIEDISDAKGITVEKANLIIDELYLHPGIEPFIKCMDGERVLYGIWTFERVLRGEFSVWSSCGCWDVPLDVVIYESSLNKPALKRDFLCYLTLFSKIQEYYNLPYYKIAEEIENNPIVKQIPRYCFFTKILLPAYDRPREIMVTHQANIEVCRTGLALKMFKAGNGTYPETLFFLSERPIDPFSGKELIYKKSGNGFILYSLGPNMKDDGGTPRVSDYKDPDYENYDIVWKCEK